MSTLNDDDLFVYQDADTGVVGAVVNSNRSSLADDDLFVVQRGGVNYKVRSADVGGGGGGAFSSVTMAPLSITPTTDQQIITCTTDIPLVNGSVPADVKWTWYLYDAATGTTGQTVLKTLTNRENIDTITLPASASGKFIGCSVEYLAVTIDEAQRCAVGTPTGPVADMNGLRFDSARKTELIGASTSSSTAWSYSCWIKKTATPNTFNVIFGWSDINKVIGVQGLAVYVYDSNTQTSFATLEANTWAHIVVTVDDGTCKAYLNGDLQATVNGNFSVPSGEPFNLGRNKLNESEYFDGYLSDVYYVDNAALEPTAFAEKYPQGWGPLDSSVVKTNITNSKVQPYDTRDNYDEEWSAGTVTTEGNVNADQLWGNMFNGDLSNHTSGSADQENARATLALPSLTWSKSVEVYPYSSPAGNQQIRINNTNIGATTVHADWQDITQYLSDAGITAINSITVGDPKGGSATQLNYAAIRIDGRMLRDGPAYNSQNWSDSCALTNGGTGVGGGTFATMFDGDLTQGINAAAGTDTFTFDIGQANKLTGAVRFYISAGTSITGDWLKVNGQPQTLLGGSVPGWITVDGVNELWSFSAGNIGPGNVYGAIAAVEVDGKLLIDSGAKWNTSQVWSNNTSGDFNNNPELIFDGSTATQTWTNGDPAIINFTGLTINSSLRVYFNTGSNYPPNPYEVVVGGVTIDISALHPAINTYAWVDVTPSLTTPVSLDQLKLSASGQGAIAAIEVDGKILVDAGTFGTNGFYLPFDPDADNYIYSQYGTGTFNTDRGWDKAFNGLTSPGDESVNPVADSVAELIFPTAIPFKSLALWAGYGGSAPNNSFLINDVDVTGQIGSTQARYPITISGATELEKIKINVPASGFDGLILAVEVDGKLLVDHNNIGVDASGNGNNFQDKNFAVGNTSQNWLSSFTCDKPQNASQSLFDAFDGNLTTTTGEQVGSAIYTFVAPLTGNYRISMYTNGIRPIKVDGVTVVTAPTEGSVKWYTIGAVTAGQVITVDGAGQAGGGFIAAWEVDGELLIQPNIQDTVIDTPMFNYAIAASGGTITNGGLERKTDTEDVSSNSVPIDKSKKYYFEGVPLDGNGGSTYIGFLQTSGQSAGGWQSRVDSDPGIGAFGSVVSDDKPNWTGGDVLGLLVDFPAGTLTLNINGVQAATGTFDNSKDASAYAYGAFSSATSHSQNYGQQPFLYATDNGNGTVTLVDSSPNRAQTWSSDLSGDALNPSYPYTDAFDGLTTTQAQTQNTNGNINWTIPAGLSGKLEVNVGQNNPQKVILDGVVILDDVVASETWHTVVTDITPYIGKVMTVKEAGSTSAAGSLAAVRVGGRLLIDGPADTSQVWSSAPTNVDTAVISNAFDGDLTTQCYSDGSTDAYFSISDVTATKVECYGFTSDGTFYVDGSSRQEVSCAAGWVQVYSGSAITVNKLGFTRSGGSGGGHSAWRINDEILIDSQDLGPYKKLYEPWSEWVSATRLALLKASESRVDALEQIILAMAIPWSYGSTYSAGDLVKFNCSVWRATSDGITTRTPIPTNSDIWENLDIDCERTHTMDDLIPDDWSQEQRRAALQELLLELSEDEPESY